jgi:type I restriction enzyme, S subunit
MADFSLLLEKELPGWSVLSLGDICIRVQGNYQPDPYGTSLYLGLEHLAQGLPMLVGRGCEADVKSSKSAFQPTDVLFGKLRPYLRKCVLMQEEGVCSTDILVFRANEKVLPQYLCYLCHTDQFVSYAKATTSGVQHPRTSWNSLREFQITLPPTKEQQRIAHILSTVQTAIEQQARLIKLIRELKSALMHKLFTEGLRGEKQKETEIGPVPESWEVVPLDACANVQTGTAKGRSIKDDESLEFPYLRVANVQDGYLDLSDIKTIKIRANERARYLLRKGDVVLTEGGDFDKLGRGFIWQGQIENCIHQNHIFAVRVNPDKLLSEFFAYQSQSPYGKEYFLSVAHKTSNLACINSAKLKRFPVLIPNLKEQKQIADVLQTIDEKLNSQRRKQDLLEELFRTLLHQLMTGQMRVNDIDLPGLP